MWKCSNCGESVEENFDLCWNCGTSQAGDTDPKFRHADDPFWHQCLRCGEQGDWPVTNDLPTCKSCEVIIRVEREDRHHCPVDGEVLTKVVVRNVVIDKCPKCHGVWLDGGELDLIKRAVATDSGDRQFRYGFMSGILVD